MLQQLLCLPLVFKLRVCVVFTLSTIWSWCKWFFYFFTGGLNSFFFFFCHCITANLDGRTGAIGFVPLIVPRVFHPLAIIRVNNQTYEPIRGSNGLCIRAETSKNSTLVLMLKQLFVESIYKNSVRCTYCTWISFCPLMQMSQGCS